MTLDKMLDVMLQKMLDAGEDAEPWTAFNVDRNVSLLCMGFMVPRLCWQHVIWARKLAVGGK